MVKIKPADDGQSWRATREREVIMRTHLTARVHNNQPSMVRGRRLMKTEDELKQTLHVLGMLRSETGVAWQYNNQGDDYVAKVNRGELEVGILLYERNDGAEAQVRISNRHYNIENIDVKSDGLVDCAQRALQSAREKMRDLSTCASQIADEIGGDR